MKLPPFFSTTHYNSKFCGQEPQYNLPLWHQSTLFFHRPNILIFWAFTNPASCFPHNFKAKVMTIHQRGNVKSYSAGTGSLNFRHYFELLLRAQVTQCSDWNWGYTAGIWTSLLRLTLFLAPTTSYKYGTLPRSYSQ